MRFEVPQFIEVEDKIFGPLTWRQFLYLSGGVGMAVVMFFTLPFILFVILGIPLAVLAAALSFYPINNRPFSYFLEAMFNYTLAPKLYLWRKEDRVMYKEDPAIKAAPSEAPVVRRTNKNISTLARELELKAIQHDS